MCLQMQATGKTHFEACVVLCTDNYIRYISPGRMHKFHVCFNRFTRVYSCGKPTYLADIVPLIRTECAGNELLRADACACGSREGCVRLCVTKSVGN
jgi:hypothetical protein